MSDLEWHSMAERAPPFSRIVTLCDDGSGASLYYVTEGGKLIDGEDGCTYEWTMRDREELWAHLPPGFKFWVERRRDPMVLPAGPSDAGAEHMTTDPLQNLIEAARAAAAKFEDYAELHRAKGTREGNAKAFANATQASHLRAAILAATPMIDKTPCGECHLKPGETCDVCGATEPQESGD